MSHIVFVPGHLCDETLYTPQRTALSNHSYQIADISQDNSISDMAERLIATAPEQFSVVGLSMGGMIAMEVMTRAPERVVSACLIGTDPSRARDREIAFRRDMQTRVARDGMITFVESFSALFYRHNAMTQRRLLPQTQAMMLRTSEHVFQQQAHALNTRADMIPVLSGCSIPTEIIVGEQDTICPPLLHHRLLASLANANLTIIPECGHISSLEHPEIVTQKIKALL